VGDTVTDDDLEQQQRQLGTLLAAEPADPFEADLGSDDNDRL
jgi:hypothetical protein